MIDDYIPTERPPCEVLWDSAQKLVDEELKLIKDIRENQEKIGSLQAYSDPAYVACSASGELDSLARVNRGDSDSTDRLIKILEATATSFEQEDAANNLRSKSAVYHALCRYEHLVDFKLDEKTEMPEFSLYVAGKTRWIIEELKNARNLPKSRVKSLVGFCVGLSRGAKKQEIPVLGLSYLVA